MSEGKKNRASSDIDQFLRVKTISKIVKSVQYDPIYS